MSKQLQGSETVYRDPYPKLYTKVKTYEQVIDAQQVKLNNLRLNPSELQKKYDAALQALAAERVQNSILKGQVEALKSKRNKATLSTIASGFKRLGDAELEKARILLDKYLSSTSAIDDSERIILFRNLWLNAKAAASHYNATIEEMIK